MNLNQYIEIINSVLKSEPDLNILGRPFKPKHFKALQIELFAQKHISFFEKTLEVLDYLLPLLKEPEAIESIEEYLRRNCSF